MREEYNTIGQILKNCRIKRKLSLEQVSNKTKISIQSLTNIENGRLDLIANKFFQKSFIKSYSKALRISVKKILLLLDGTNKAIEETNSNTNKINIEESKLKIISEKIPTIPLMIFAFFGLALVIVINFVTNSEKTNNRLADIKPKEELKISLIDDNFNNNIENIQNDVPLKQTNVNINENEIDQLNLNNNLFLKQIIAKEDVWIEIKDLEQNILISTVLKKNETFNLPNYKDNIIISASNAGALSIKNGNEKNKILGPLGTILNSVDLNSLITNH